MNRKKIILLALAFTVLNIVAVLDAKVYSQVQVRIIPETPVVGEPAELRLISNVGVVEVKELPIVPGLAWESHQSRQITQTSVTRRQAIFSTVFTFTMNKEGSVKIPAIRVKLANQIQKIGPITVKAEKQKLLDSKGKSNDIDELLYLSAVFMGDSDQIFVGEEIPLEIRMYSVRGLPVNCSWPTIDVENIMLKDYGRINPDNSHFLQPVRRTVKLKNKTYNVDIFKTSIRPIAPGTLKGDIIIPCIIKVPRDNNQRRSRNSLEDIFNNDFFGSRYRNIKYKLTTTIPEKVVQSLPTIQNNSKFLGIVGDWHIQTTLSSSELKSGDPVTLMIAIRGIGTLDTLNAPELKIPGFEVYPPEVKKSEISPTGRSSAEIRYALIPLDQGPINIDLSFSYFSPKRSKYKISKYDRSFNIKKGKKSNSIVDDSQPNIASSIIPYSIDKKNKLREGILYLKRGDGGYVSIPLYKNKIFAIIFFILVGPILLILFELFYFKKQKLSSDPLLRRKSNAKKRKSKLLTRLKASSDDELANIIQNDITPYINDMFGYPPGTTSDELANKVENKKLAICFRAGSTSTYMPGAIHGDPKKLRDDLLHLIQKITIISILFIAPFTLISDTVLNEKEVDLSNPLTAYDTGHFKVAEKYYRKGITSKQVSPTALYNLGNCLFQQGRYAEALLYYERAHLLNPSDSDIVENLNFIRRKLILPEINKAQHPIAALKNMRDDIRPDTWLLIISILWSLSWIILLFRRYLTQRSWRIALTFSTVLFIIAIFAYYSQRATTYSSKNGIVIAKNIPIYSLPTTTSNKSEFKLKEGSAVHIEEKRHNWMRVRDDSSEGWVKSNAIQQLWPY